MSSRVRVFAWMCVVVAGVHVAPVRAAGQSRAVATSVTWLPLDTALAPTERIGCEGVRHTDGRGADVAAARAAWREAQEALLEGDRMRARTRLEASIVADPRDLRTWNDLGAVQEQLGDSTAARSSACRVLASPAATVAQREDAQRRWQRLLPGDVARRATRAAQRHADGVRLAQRRNWSAARAAFDEVVRVMPSAPSAWRNRAIVTAEAGDVALAQRDLEHYVQMGPPASERLLLTRALNALQRPRYHVGTALAAGLIPGGAQFVTGRPALGTLVLSAAVGGGVLAVTPRTRERLVPFLDPNGEPAPYTERYRVYPYRSAGIAAAATVLIGALVEGSLYAARSSELPRLVARREGVGVELAFGVRRSRGGPPVDRMGVPKSAM